VQSEFRYRGRDYSAAEIESVRQLIAAHPGLSRRRLSAKLCAARLRRECLTDCFKAIITWDILGPSVNI
jgi:hypothetical protein